jgi:ABC-type multidrug transport system ATPase subunit
MLEARNLGKFYSGIPAVKDVNFTVRRGEVLGLLGPNGSGKSTTVSMVTSLLEPTTGQVLFDGEGIGRSPLEYKAIVGYVPEEAHLYSYLTGPEYLELVWQLRGIQFCAFTLRTLVRSRQHRMCFGALSLRSCWPPGCGASSSVCSTHCSSVSSASSLHTC